VLVGGGGGGGGVVGGLVGCVGPGPGFVVGEPLRVVWVDRWVVVVVVVPRPNVVPGPPAVVDGPTEVVAPT
jgi:hypothetical protein